MQRVVAIVGRPNVGKSAIFNRLTGRRVAIVHPDSGVTRDRLFGEVRRGEERFQIVDTGGIGTLDDSMPSDRVEAEVRRQVEAALEDASAVLFVVDCAAGRAPLDEEVARLLRAQPCAKFVAANKADDEGRALRAGEFERFGWPVFAVSALHGRGFGPLLDAVVRVLPPGESADAGRPVRVAVVGRPNVGKSSLINRVLRSDRVIVSAEAGTTRDSVEVPFAVGRGEQARRYVFVDTAGMRRRGRIRSSVERFSLQRAERSIREADVVVLVLDAVQGPTAQDKRIASAIMAHGRGCVVAVNKWDLAGATQQKAGPLIARMMPFMGHCPLVFVSAASGYNIRRAVEAVDRVAAQMQTALPTGMLNRTILSAQAAVPPPRAGGKRLRIYYATQTGSAPPRVRVFVNDPGCVRAAYHDYLVNVLRRRFGLEGVRVVLEFTSRRKGSQRNR